MYEIKVTSPSFLELLESQESCSLIGQDQRWAYLGVSGQTTSIYWL